MNNNKQQIENQKSETTHYSKCGCKKCIGYGGSYYKTMKNKNKQQVEEMVEEKLQEVWERLPDDLTSREMAYVTTVEPHIKRALEETLYQAKEEERERIMEKLVGEAQYYKCSKKCSGISPFCVTVDDIKALLTPKKDA